VELGYDFSLTVDVRTFFFVNLLCWFTEWFGVELLLSALLPDVGALTVADNVPQPVRIEMLSINKEPVNRIVFFKQNQSLLFSN